MSGEVNNHHRVTLRALHEVAEQEGPTQTTENSGAPVTQLVGLGQSQANAHQLGLEQRLRLVTEQKQPLSREQVRSRLDAGLLAAVELGERQANGAQQTLDREALSLAKEIATSLGKVLGAGNLSISRHQSYELPGARVIPSDELTQLLGGSLADRALQHKVKQLLDPVLSGRGLSISFADGKGVRVGLSQPGSTSEAHPEVSAALGLGLSQSAGRKEEIGKLGQQIGAAFLTQLVLKAKVAAEAGVNLLPIDRLNRTPLREQLLEVPLNFDPQSLGPEAARLYQGLQGTDLNLLWATANTAIRDGIAGTRLADLPLPFLRCDAKNVTFGYPLRPTWGQEGRATLPHHP